MKKNHVYALIIYFGVLLLGDVITPIFNDSKSLMNILYFTLFPLLLLVTLYLLKDVINLIVFEKRKSTVIQSIYAIIRLFFYSDSCFYSYCSNNVFVLHV